ncbi:MAG: aminotransferase class I/II-fold pyridoxal phosphate-dependent enzyme [Cyclobacteriaceae bacterium]|nr:aminotransferase class I/II-fold pyridoxal phosphate-dependent enzyme [Cyclobacteriaceae bacterium]
MSDSFIPLSGHDLSMASVHAFQAQHQFPPAQALGEFERLVASKTGVAHAVAVSSGTAAIHLALKLAGVRPGDWVLAPTFTYVATINPIRYLGAEPILIDAEEETWNLDPGLLREAILDALKQGKRPAACLVVNTYGTPSHWGEVKALCREHGIPVIEDAAESLGAAVDRQPSGSLGDIGITSFNNNKVITCFGGGAVLLKDQQQTERVLYWATQARSALPYYEHREVGYNYRMSPLQALWGLTELPELDERVRKRRAVFQRYREELGDLITKTQHEDVGAYSNRWLSSFIFRGERALALQQHLLEQRIESRPLWNPMHHQPAFSDVKAYRNGVSDRLFRSGICLPSGHELLGSDQKKVVDSVRHFFRQVANA